MGVPPPLARPPTGVSSAAGCRDLKWGRELTCRLERNRSSSKGGGNSIPVIRWGPSRLAQTGRCTRRQAMGPALPSPITARTGNPLNPLGDPPVGIGGVQTPPMAQRGATRAQSFRRVSGLPVVLTGTLIRVDPFTGAALSNNPLFSHADPNARRIVGYGFRNPFRFTVRPGTNELWVGDVGWVTGKRLTRFPIP